jgi:hypothetical protein
LRFSMLGSLPIHSSSSKHEQGNNDAKFFVGGKEWSLIETYVHLVS